MSFPLLFGSENRTGPDRFFHSFSMEDGCEIAASKYSMMNTEVVIFADNTFWHKKKQPDGCFFLDVVDLVMAHYAYICSLRFFRLFCLFRFQFFVLTFLFPT